MAYSNAIFYIDLVNGNDGARTALTGCTASNPSGSTVRITKALHGLVTGAIVDLTSFDALLNGTWKIAVLDANNFDLVDAMWSVAITTTTGTVTPRGGSSWTDAWRTGTSGATAARIQQGDSIRINKSQDPVSMGTATWTNQSRTVTLASALTTTIDNCESGWVAANSAIISHSTSARKQGTNSVGIYRSSAYATNTLYAYKNLGTVLNLSSYDAITFFYSFGSNYQNQSNVLKICLCSDTAGTTIVDTFIVPAIAFGSQQCISSHTVTRVGGGNLGSSIRSIAIYSHTSLPSWGLYHYFDNISACSSTGLNLNSLISKNGAAYGGVEGWYPIQSIDGTNIQIDNQMPTGPGTGRGYYGTTETVTSYFRNPHILGPFSNWLYTNASSLTTTKSGISQSLRINYSGGWNTSTNLQDGDTYISGLNSQGGGFICGHNFIAVERIRAVRFEYGFRINASYCTFNDISAIGNAYAGIGLNGYANTIRCDDLNNNQDGFYTGGTTINSIASPGNTIVIRSVSNNLGSGMVLDGVNSANIRPHSLVLSASNVHNNGNYGMGFYNVHDNVVTLSSSIGNGLAAVYNTVGKNYLRNSTLGGTEFAGAVAGYDSKVFSTNHDGTLYGWIYTDGGTINSQATTFSAGTGAEWRLNVTSSTRNFGYPLKLTAAQYAVNSGSAIRVDAVMKKSHATDVAGRLVIPGGQLAGIPNDVVATLSNNTSEQTLSLSCIPAQTGVIDVEVWAEYVNNTGIVYVDEITFKY